MPGGQNSRTKRGKNPLQTVEQMAMGMVEEKRKKTDAQIAREESLNTDIAMARAALKAAYDRQKVDLGDPLEVRERISEYFQACEIANAYPSVMGLAVKAFGVERQAVEEYIKRHPEAESVKLIIEAKQAIADIIVNQSLKGNAQPVAAIFQLKNWYEHTDKVTFAQGYSESVDVDTDSLKKKYGVIEVPPEDIEVIEPKE